MYRPEHTHYAKSIPGMRAIVDTFGTRYTTARRGLSQMQIQKACDKAWVETINQMGIVLDQQYSALYVVRPNCPLQ